MKLASYAGLLISTAIWGSTFFIVKDTLHSINPITLVAYRFIIATIIFAVIVLFRRDQFWNNWKHGFILGFLLWIQYSTQTIGLKYITASSSGFINALFIIFVPLFGFLFFKKKLTTMQVIALVVAVTGLWFLTGGFHDFSFGVLISLIPAISTGMYILVIDKFVHEKKSVVTLNFQQFFTVAALSIITMVVFRSPITIGKPQTLIPILYLAIFGNAIGQGLLLLCQKNLQPVTASILLSTEPVFAAVFSWTFGNEIFVLLKAIGGLCIVLSTFIADISINKRKNIKRTGEITY